MTAIIVCDGPECRERHLPRGMVNLSRQRASGVRRVGNSGGTYGSRDRLSCVQGSAKPGRGLSKCFKSPFVSFVHVEKYSEGRFAACAKKFSNRSISL